MSMLETIPSAAETPSRPTVQFTVRGLPAPQGSKTYLGHSAAGRAILGESSQKVRPWRQDVVSAAEDALSNIPGFRPFQGPVHLIVEFYLPRPKSAPKTRRVVPAVTPDLDKLIRSTADALKTAAVWRDDSQVVDITIRKRYATFGDEAFSHAWELPGIGAVITVVELTDDDTWADQPLDLHATSRFPFPILPLEISRHAAIAEIADISTWGTALVITRDMTDARARAVAEKAVKAIAKREEKQVAGEAPTEALALIIEDGAARLASTPGKPLSPLQALVAAVATDGLDVEVVVLMARELAG